MWDVLANMWDSRKQDKLWDFPHDCGTDETYYMSNLRSRSGRTTFSYSYRSFVLTFDNGAVFGAAKDEAVVRGDDEAGNGELMAS